MYRSTCFHSIPSSVARLTPIALLVLGFMDGAFAQQTEAAASRPAVDTVTVTGFKASSFKSIADKQDSLLTMDGVTADEIGKLPDFNVGDVLKRVTGVNTMSYQGEPRFVVVRGLNANYNSTLIDGFAFATADIGSRQVLMEVLPSNFIHSVGVTKSFLPESDGGAVGGVVDMRTASGYNFKDNALNLSVKGGESLMGSQYGGNHPGGEAAASWAKRFGNHDEYAFLGTASYWKRHMNVPQVEAGGTLDWYNNNGTKNSTPYGGNGYAVPKERRWYNYDNDRTRAGLTARLDWKPNGPLSGHVSGFYFKQQEISDRDTQIASGAATVSNQTPTSGRLNSVNQQNYLGRLRWDRDLYGINGEAKYEINQDWTADLRGSASRAKSSNPQIWDQFTQKNMAFNYDYASGRTPTFTPVNMANANNPSLYTLDWHRLEQNEYTADVKDVQANARYNMKEESRGFGAAFGGRIVSTRTNTEFSRTTWTGMGYTLADVWSGQTVCGFNCNTSMMMVDPAKADALFNQFLSKATVTSDTKAQYAKTYGVREDVYAGYAQTQYRADRWVLAGGLRLEKTDEHTDGYLSSDGGKTFALVGDDRSYQNLLPSFAGSYDTGSASKLRFGVSKTIGRPRFDDMATQGAYVDTGKNPPVMSLGNPDLKPRRSTNFDIGHDWYLDGGQGIFSVAFFHKDIDDEIFNFGQTVNMDVNGVSTPVLVTQARNVANRVRINGVEFGLIKQLDFITPALKGFGYSANVSFIRGTFPVTLTDGSSTQLSVLPQQPKEIWNMALFYERGGVHAKLAWNHIGKLWDDRFSNYTPTGFYANRYQQATNNVDFQLAYDVNKQLTLTFDALNITSQGAQYNYGKTQEYVQSAWKIGPTILLGLNYKM